MRLMLPIMFCLAVASSAVAEDVITRGERERQALRAKHALLERLALVLTGQLPTQTAISDYVSGKKDLLASARVMRDSELFEERLSYYYQEVLKIIQPLDFLNIYTFPLYIEVDEFHSPHKRNSRLRADQQLLGGEYQVFKDTETGDHATIMRYLERLANPRKFDREKRNKISLHLQYDINDEHYFMSLFRGNAAALTKVLSSKAEYKPLLDTLRSAHHCRGLEIDVIPYWGDKPVKACPSTVDEQYCGARLQDCFPYPTTNTNKDPNNTYRSKVAAALTLEPSRMIAKTVREEKKFSTIVTTSKGLVNGYLLHYLKNFDPIFSKKYMRHRIYIDNEMTAENRVVFTIKPNDYPNIANALPAVKLTDEKYYWVERGGNHHAGILTTFAFHRATNGRRAKANKARSALLCRDFADPPNAVADAQDTRPLDQRAYCKDCHQFLEPLAKFFYRYPDTGNDSNYFYDHTLVQQTSSYVDVNCQADCAKTGDGVQGFAEIIVNHKQDNSFKVCAIKRAFEFILRKSMTQEQEDSLLPTYLKIYDDNQENLWKVMEAVINSDMFKASVYERFY
ncbi:MAG: hypothetical protein OYH77_06255 [Pseudomonadota bacterium]|nr:hypothetical protein [Pseudomonadota bacterium]